MTSIATSPTETDSNKKYLYLYTCEQSKKFDGTIVNSVVLLDDSTTVIDGGKIITGSVTANQLDAASVKADIVQTTELNADKITSGILSADRIDTSSIFIGQSQVTGLTGALAEKQPAGDYATNQNVQTDIANAVSSISVGGRNLLRGTRDFKATS